MGTFINISEKVKKINNFFVHHQRYTQEKLVPSLNIVLDTTLYDRVCEWLATVSSTNKTDRHDITEILLNVSLNTIALTPYVFFSLNTYYFQPYFFFNHLLYSKMWLKLGNDSTISFQSTTPNFHSIASLHNSTPLNLLAHAATIWDWKNK
jgi:hypothetical protein